MCGDRAAAGIDGGAHPEGLRYAELTERDAASARCWLEDGPEGTGPAQLRPAASVVYVRQGQDGLETYLTYRTTPGSPLGRVGFPGGVAESGDKDPVGWFGPTPTQWAQKFGHEEVAPARSAVVAAVRESFEEIGVLLAGPDDQNTVEGGETSESMAAREAVAGHELDFADYLRRGQLKLRTDLLKPLARWQSPDFSHRRFDVHYFAAVVPVGQKPRLLASKGRWGRWVPVRELMAEPESTALGEEIGAEDTVGVPLRGLLTPGALCLLESMVRCGTAVAFLTRKRTVHVRKAELAQQEDRLVLAFSAPPEGCAPRAKGV